MTTSNIAPQSQNCDTDFCDDQAEWEEILRAGTLTAGEHPAFKRYCRHFYDYCPKRPYHVKYGYETGFIARKKKYKTTEGDYYIPCRSGSVERHLDFYDRRPYWLGLRFGKKSSVKCLDFDNKPNVLGLYEVGGVWRPVVHLPLDHFRTMKRIYDAFPRHVWCVSSATLGLHIWERLGYPQTALDVERKNRPKLMEIGLAELEVYPSPQLMNWVLRRPFGQDYYTITDDGLLFDWVEQLDHFESATRSPSFPTIVRSLVELERVGWRIVESGATFRRKQESPFAFKRFLNNRLLEREAETVLDWIDAGCPEESPAWSKLVSSSERVPEPAVNLDPTRKRSRRSSAGGSGRWSWRKVMDLARNGIPEEHRLFEYLLLLARPLVWRDYYHLPPTERVRKAEEDLLYWVLNKHNGLVTRVQQGQIDNIRHEVRRQVTVALTKTDISLTKFYDTMRQNDRVYPSRVQRISDLIRSKPTSSSSGCCLDHITDQQDTVTQDQPVEANDTTSNKDSSSFSLVCCMRYIKEPDDTPLPVAVLQKLEGIAKDNGMRRSGGEYPFIRFARRLLNAVWVESGAAEVHGDSLRAWCGTKNRAQVVGYKLLMARAELISDQWEGHAQPGVSSAVYQMTPETFALFHRHHGTPKVMKRVESRFTVTALTTAKLEEMELGWDV